VLGSHVEEEELKKTTDGWSMAKRRHAGQQEELGKTVSGYHTWASLVQHVFEEGVIERPLGDLLLRVHVKQRLGRQSPLVLTHSECLHPVGLMTCVHSCKQQRDNA
jgi:hypothetical protein